MEVSRKQKFRDRCWLWKLASTTRCKTAQEEVSQARPGRHSQVQQRADRCRYRHSSTSIRLGELETPAAESYRRVLAGETCLWRCQPALESHTVLLFCLQFSTICVQAKSLRLWCVCLHLPSWWWKQRSRTCTQMQVHQTNSCESWRMGDLRTSS